MSLLRFDPHLTFCDLENKREIEKKIREILIQGHRDPPRGFKKNEMYFQANLITLLVLTGLFDNKIEIYLGSKIIKNSYLRLYFEDFEVCFLGLFGRLTLKMPYFSVFKLFIDQDNGNLRTLHNIINSFKVR